MYRERIAEDVYVFTSGLYAQVTAAAVITPDGAIVIDTLPFPSETRQILDFLDQRSPAGIRYLVLTHYHADHSMGASLFAGVPIIAYARCRELLAERGEAALAAAREQNPELHAVSLRLPDIVFDGGELTVRLGGKSIVLTHLPGHSEDCLAAYLKDDKILFASDVMTPVPILVDGDPRRLIESLRRIKSFGLENVVQGHGEMILRGEINESVNSNVYYLNRVLALVAGLLRDGRARDAVSEYGIESCGKSRIPLHGLVQQFHAANLAALYDQMRSDSDLYRLGLRLLAERQASKAEVTQSRDRPKSKATKKAARVTRTRKKSAPEPKRSSRIESKSTARAKAKSKSGAKTGGWRKAPRKAKSGASRGTRPARSTSRRRT